MKRIIMFSLLFAFGTTSFCQQTVQKQSLTKEDYLQKSKKQKKIGWILIGSGAAMFIVSEVIPEGELTGEISWPCLCEDVHENDDIKGVFILVGAASMLGSIPFFIASGKSKKKAASISLKNYPIPILRDGNMVNRIVPALSFKVHL